MTKTKTVQLYRIENPSIVREPDGIVSHPDLVGSWFTPELKDAVGYLKKSTRTSGRKPQRVPGARLIIATIPEETLEDRAATKHPIAKTMDIEPNSNYILTPDEISKAAIHPLDEIVDAIEGSLNNPNVRIEATKRIAHMLGHAASNGF